MTRTKDAGEKIDAIMERASVALVERRYFACESLCLDAMELARRDRDYERMARICLPLQESRRLKRDLAADSRQIFVIDDQLPKATKLQAGCYLVRPPRVGLDGRMLREMADRRETPIIVVTREPTTRDGLWPVVAIGPITLRTKVAPPVPGAGKKRGTKKNGVQSRHADDSPECAIPPVEWFLAACEALGDAAIAGVDAARSPAARVEHLLMRLGSLPDHEKLHQALAAACAEAALSTDVDDELDELSPEAELERELAQEAELGQPEMADD